MRLNFTQPLLRNFGPKTNRREIIIAQNSQRDLASVRVSEIKAIIDYKMSVANLEKVLGTILKTKNIKFRDYDF